jgi:hypothetical protein
VYVPLRVYSVIFDQSLVSHKLQDSELRLLMAELSSYLLQQNRPFNNTNLVDSMAAKLKVGKTAVTKALDTLESESLVQVNCLMIS